MAESDSRAALLEAAWELCAESFGSAGTPVDPKPGAQGRLFETLTTSAIAHRAGLSTGAFYNRWPTREDFIDEFLDHALSIDRYPNPEKLFEVFAAMANAEAPDLLTTLAQRTAAVAEASPTYAIQRYLWSFCRGREDVARRLERLYEELRDRMLPFYETVLTHLGREMRPPFTLRSGTVLLGAMLDGLIERRGPGGDAAPPAEMFAWALLAVVPSITCAVGDQRDLRAFVADELATRGDRGKEHGSENRTMNAERTP